MNFIPYDEKKNNSMIVLNRRFDNYDRYLDIVQDDVDLFKKNFDDFMKKYSKPTYIKFFS